MREQTPVEPPRRTWEEVVQERAKEYKRHWESRKGQNEVVWNGYTAVPTPVVWNSQIVNSTRYEITKADSVTVPQINISTTTHFK